MKLLHKLSAENQIKITEECKQYLETGITIKKGLNKSHWIDLTIEEATMIHRAVAPVTERFGITELSDLFNN